MKTNRITPILSAVLVLLAVTLACAGGATAEPTAVPPTDTAAPSETPTPTVAPTKTPRPTATPNVAQTQSYEDMSSAIQRFKDEGLIPTTDGKYIVMDSFKEDFAQIGWLSYQYTNLKFENFLYRAHVEWKTAVDTTDTSGCGVVFALQERGDQNEYYGVILDRSRIYFTVTKSGYYYDLGKTRGTGRLDFGNPAAADFTLLVYDYKAYVYVDDEFIGEYTLSKDKDLNGYFGYGIISGTNRDYGTHCEISKARMWTIEQ